MNEIKETKLNLKEVNDTLDSGCVEGFSVTGDYISNLKDKSFTIVSIPKYEIMKSMNDENSMVRKLKLIIKLTDGAIMDYYPNKTSQKKIMDQVGVKLSNWEGVDGEFEVLEQMVGQQKKKVIYIKSTIPRRPAQQTK